MNQPLISLICATYNSAELLPNLIHSVQKQPKEFFEFIIIDNCSTDNTINIIKKNRNIIDNYISEPDKGIYDAWNKGIKLAKGKWVGFIGADDILLPQYINIYQKKITEIPKNTDYLASQVNYIDSDGKILLRLGKEWNWNKFKISMTSAHVGSLHNVQLFQEIGMYNTNYKIAGDYELLLRKRNNLKTAFINEPSILMNSGGVSLSIRALKERYTAQVNTAKLPRLTATLIFIYGIISLLKLKFYVK